jgi:hypothetical protein
LQKGRLNQFRLWPISFLRTLQIQTRDKFHQHPTGSFCTASRFRPNLLAYSIEVEHIFLLFVKAKLAVILLVKLNGTGEQQLVPKMTTGAFALCTRWLVKLTPGRNPIKEK